MFGWRRFFKILEMAFMIRFDEDNGGGGEDNGGYEGGEHDTPPPAPTPPSSESVTLSKADLEELMAPIHALREEKAINDAVSMIKGRHSDFDLGKVHEHLKEIHKTDPARAEQLNNPAGWEMLWRADIATKEVMADAVNPGRNVDSDGGRSALKDRVRSGEASVHERHSLFEKYV